MQRREGEEREEKKGKGRGEEIRQEERGQKKSGGDTCAYL